MSVERVFHSPDPERYKGPGWYVYFLGGLYGPFESQREARESLWDFCEDEYADRDLWDAVQADHEWQQELRLDPHGLGISIREAEY